MSGDEQFSYRHSEPKLESGGTIMCRHSHSPKASFLALEHGLRQGVEPVTSGAEQISRCQRLIHTSFYRTRTNAGERKGEKKKKEKKGKGKKKRKKKGKKRKKKEKKRKKKKAGLDTALITFHCDELRLIT